MPDSNFQPIFDYIDQTKEALKAQMASKSDIERVITAIDAIAKRTYDHEDKTTILENKSERIEHWAIQAAEKIDIPYKP